MEESGSREELERRAHAEALSIVSHDIRAPLGVILGAVTELLDPQIGPLTDEQRSLVQLVRRSGEKLARLAANVLFLNRIETRRVELQRQRVDARMIARRALESFERSSELARIKATADYGETPFEVDADPERAVHAIVNVMANAVRFARAELRVRVEGDENVARVIVEDDGPGIGAEQMPLLFDRDARLRASSGPSPMRGFGLLVAKTIVDAHGGSIGGETITSDAGRPVGARFTIALPRSSRGTP